jgi:hypothetical protein
MAFSWMLRRVALVRIDVSEELSASIIRVTRIGELGTLAVTSNRRTSTVVFIGYQASRSSVVFFYGEAIQTLSLKQDPSTITRR